MRFRAKTGGWRVGNVGGYLPMKIHRLPASLLKHIAAAFLLVQSAIAADLPAKPLKVFILAGQSNMQGQGIVTAQDKDGSEKPGTLVSMPQNPVIVLKFMA